MIFNFIIFNYVSMCGSECGFALMRYLQRPAKMTAWFPRAGGTGGC